MGRYYIIQIRDPKQSESVEGRELASVVCLITDVVDPEIQSERMTGKLATVSLAIARKKDPQNTQNVPMVFMRRVDDMKDGRFYARWGNAQQTMVEILYVKSRDKGWIYSDIRKQAKVIELVELRAVDEYDEDSFSVTRCNTEEEAEDGGAETPVVEEKEIPQTKSAACNTASKLLTVMVELEKTLKSRSSKHKGKQHQD